MAQSETSSRDGSVPRAGLGLGLGLAAPPDTHTYESQPLRPMSNTWGTGLCDFIHDEETCWWGLWCPHMVQARTLHSYQLGDSLYLNSCFLMTAALMVTLTLTLGGLGLLLSLGIGVGLVVRNARFRKRIRIKEGIAGSLFEDCCTYCWCYCCAVCQEARVSKRSGAPKIDFCSGEVLISQQARHDEAAGMTSMGPQGEGGSLYQHLSAISKTSKIILGMCMCVFALEAVFLGMVNPLNIIVLLLALLQPVVVLWVVYWRKRRAYASLDMVIKMFAIGFWLTTTVAAIVESIMQTVLVVIFAAIAGVSISGTDDAQQNASDTSSNQFSPVLHSILSEALATSTTVDATGSDNDSALRASARHMFWLVLLGLFIMAFVIAAGVEETMKHFIVRCCQFPAPLNDPHSILIYLMSGALGFACMENIMYVFQYGAGGVAGELLVLLLRVCMPIHVICSALQAINVSKVLLLDQRMSLFMTLLPAILYHGLFDFTLFALSAVQYAWEIESSGMGVASLVLGALITAAGATYTIRAVKDNQANFAVGWQRIHNPDDETGDVQL